MIELKAASTADFSLIMDIIKEAKLHLRQQGIDQWQQGYPDDACIRQDLAAGKGFLLVEEEAVLGYLCIDFGGEPAYEGLSGSWLSPGSYLVVHRMAFTASARGRGTAATALSLAQEVARSRGVHDFRVDTDAANEKMKHILQKCGFQYRGTICFDNSEKIAYEKLF